jgi:hypothetical protein
MPKSNLKSQRTIDIEVSFPSTRKKKAEERKALLNRLKSLTEKDTELQVDKISSKKYDLTLLADEFESRIYFNKPIKFRIFSHQDIEKNENRINNFANKLVNYLNTILGESSKGAKSFVNWMIAEEKGFNLAKEFIEETKLAKINEMIKKTIEPKGIMFEYKSGSHKNSVMHFYSEDLILFSGFSTSEYKDRLPWDFISEEYKNRKDVINIIEKLGQKEFQ